MRELGIIKNPWSAVDAKIENSALHMCNPYKGSRAKRPRVLHLVLVEIH
jgi:hypothetical protein